LECTNEDIVPSPNLREMKNKRWSWNLERPKGIVPSQLQRKMKKVSTKKKKLLNIPKNPEKI